MIRTSNKRNSLYDATSLEALWNDHNENDEGLPSDYGKLPQNRSSEYGEQTNIHKYSTTDQAVVIDNSFEINTSAHSWIDPETTRFVCMWTNCTVRGIRTKQCLETHITYHLERNVFAIEGNNLKCPIVGCTFASTFGNVVKSHISMHVHHALLQHAAILHIRAHPEFINIKACGFKPILQVDFDGLDLTCCWEYCAAVFENVSDYFDHITYHVNSSEKGDKFDAEFHCGWQGCNKKFRNKGDLRKHSNRHVSLKKCACPFCGAWMNSWEKLGLHLKRKIQSDDYKCMQCRKCFADAIMLARHLSQHVFNEKCELCGVLFRIKSELDKHMQTVHCEQKKKSWICNFPGCGEVFQSTSQLVLHKQTHEITQFKCKLCDMKFVYQTQLISHKRTSHPEVCTPNLYECHICLKRVENGRRLGYHLRKKHEYKLPDGFRRFTYKQCSDQIFRVATMKITKELLYE